jgi:hypothetical protein
MEVADMDRLAAFMKTKPAADAMEHDGVLQETLVIPVHDATQVHTPGKHAKPHGPLDPRCR